MPSVDVPCWYSYQPDIKQYEWECCDEGKGNTNPAKEQFYINVMKKLWQFTKMEKKSVYMTTFVVIAEKTFEL